MSTRLLNFFSQDFSATAIAGTLTAILAVLPSPVHALTLIAERSALGSNDQIDWSSLGKVLNPFSPDIAAFLPNSFSQRSEKGLGLFVDIPLAPSPDITPPFVFQTSVPPNSVRTNFSDGDFILFTGFIPGPSPAVGNPGPVTINFDTPVLGAGTQIAVDDTRSFTAFISAFDPANNLLGTFSTLGTSSVALDNSALFLGVISDTPNISRLVYSSSEPNRALAINTLSITAINEPTFILGLFAFGIGAIYKFRRTITSI